MAATEEAVDLTTFPAWMVELRARHGFTQQQLARRLGVHRSTISRWEAVDDGNDRWHSTRPIPIMRHVLTLLGQDVGMPEPPED